MILSYSAFPSRLDAPFISRRYNTGEILVEILSQPEAHGVQNQIPTSSTGVLCGASPASELLGPMAGEAFTEFTLLLTELAADFSSSVVGNAPEWLH